MKTKIKYFIPVLFFTPLLALAQSTGILDLLNYTADLVDRAIFVVAGIALLVFMWGLTKFILVSGDVKNKEQGQNLMKWGLISLFVMMSVWGILRFFQDEFELDTSPLELQVPSLQR